MDKRQEQIYQDNLKLFQDTGVKYQSWQHEPILDFEADSRIAKQLGWTAAPTKSLFLKLRGGGYCLLLTHRDQRLDAKAVKALVGKRPSVCSNDEMVEQLGCEPGAVCPFCMPSSVQLIIDPVLYGYKELMYTPGRPDYTFAFASRDLNKLLETLSNPVCFLLVSSEEDGCVPARMTV